jgi:hypothetical protein
MEQLEQALAVLSEEGASEKQDPKDGRLEEAAAEDDSSLEHTPCERGEAATPDSGFLPTASELSSPVPIEKYSRDSERPAPSPIADLVSPIPKKHPSARESDRPSACKQRYSFPLGLVWHPEATTAVLEARLNDLLTAPYTEIRDEYCAINIELNLRSKVEAVKSPRFRIRRKPRPRRKGESYPAADALLSNDTQVIDLHWLHQIGRRSAHDTLAAQALRSGVFDFAAASEFACRRGAVENKVGWIGLGLHEQWQLASLASTAVRSHAKELELKRKRLVDVLSEKAHFDHSVRGNEKTWATLGMAFAIGFACASRAPGATAVAKWMRVITGKELSRQAISKKLKSLESRGLLWKGGTPLGTPGATCCATPTATLS